MPAHAVTEKAPIESAVAETNETPSPESFSDGPVLLLDQPSTLEGASLRLDFYSRPISLGGRRFLKLSGIVLGHDPVAVIEVGGSGRLVAVGAVIEGFQVERINPGEICLKRIGAPNPTGGSDV